ncbi:MAG TPA: PD-(D/E)XK nuclease family protein [Dissulfurispiraceae bacterium]|nr:PD-(D/E)XK nuclease family protein [Dissulfurispiraceae bacterium]
MIARILHPRQSLISEVADSLSADDRDYSDNLVVFPGKRPAHFLRKELGQRLRSSYIPPQILSMDAFIDLMYVSISSGKPVEPLDAVAQLYEVHLSLERRLGSKGFTTLDLFFRVGMQLYRDIEELTIEQVPLDRVRDLGSVADIVVPSASSDRMINIAAYAEKFYDGLRRHGKATRAMRYCEVARHINDAGLEKFQKIIFAGFFTFTSAERLILNAMRPLESLVCLFQDGPYLEENLSILGIVAERTGTALAERKISFLACPDIHGEVCAVGDMLQKLRGNPASDSPDLLNETTAIVLPSAETLFPLLHHALAGWEERSFNVTLGYPLVRTPVFGFFRALSEMITSMDGGRIYVPAYIALVLHPYTKNIYFQGSAEITRILFHTIEEEMSGGASPSFIVAGLLEGNSRMLQRAAERLKSEGHDVSAHELGEHLADIHRRIIRPFFNIASVSDFAEKSIALIEYLHDHSTARFHPLFYPYVETIARALGEVRRSGLGRHSFSDAAGYFSFFEHFLMTCSVPFEGTPLRGLQVLGVLETRALRFERVFLLDANEDILPVARKNDSYLPARARELLGLPTHRDRDRMAHYYFSTLVEGAGEVTILFLENDRMEKTRFVERMMWEEERKTGRLRGDDACPSLQYRVRLSNRTPDPVKKTPVVAEMLRNFEFSASAIDRYLSCPLGFYYRDVLGLRQKDENSGELERSDIGIIVHDALKDYLQNISGQRLSAGKLSGDHMSGIVENIFIRRFGEKPFGPGYLLMKQVQRRLASFVNDYLVPLSGKHAVSILSSEETLKMHFHGFNLKGRLDAAFSINGRPTVIDFKTSARKTSYVIAFGKLNAEDRETWGRSIGSLQLPVYRLLYSNFSGLPVADIDAMYLILGMTHIDSGIELPLFGPNDDRVVGTRMLDDLISRLFIEIVDETIPFLPTSDLKNDCRFCDYRVMCGTQWVVR